MSAAAQMTPPAQQQMDLVWQQRWQQEVAEEWAPSPQQQMDPMRQQDEQAAEEWMRQILARAPPPSPLQQQQARAWLADWAEQQRAGIQDWTTACSFCIWTVPLRTAKNRQVVTHDDSRFL